MEGRGRGVEGRFDRSAVRPLEFSTPQRLESSPVGWLGLLIALSLPHQVGAWDCAYALGDDQQVVVRVADLVRLTNSFTQRREVAPDAKKRLDTLRGHLGAFDLDGLYADLPESAGSKTRTFEVFGRMHPLGRYDVAAIPPRIDGRPGDSKMTLRLSPTSGAPYRLQSDMRMNVGLTADELLDVGGRLIAWARFASHGCAAKKGFDPCDARVREALREAFPATVALVERYVEFSDLVAADRGGVRARIATRVRLEQLAKDYPGVAATLQRGAGLASSRIRIRGSDGATVLIAKVDSARRESVATFPLDLRRLQKERYETTMEIDSQSPGVSMHIAELTVHTNVVRTEGDVRLVSTLRKMPRIDVDATLVDVLIPSDMQTLVGDFFRVLTKSNAGTGARWWSAFPKDASGPIAFGADVEIEQQDFVTFMLRLVQRLRFSEAERNELNALIAAGIRAFDSDFARFQQQLAMR